MDELTYKGLWWIPGKSRQKVAGTLTFSDESGAVLDLMGTLEPLTDRLSGQSVTLFPFILGMTSKGERVTLLKSFQRRVNFGNDGFPTSEYRSHIIIIGQHYTRASRIWLESLRVEYEHLREWIGASGILWNQDQDDRVSIECSRPPSVTFKIRGYGGVEFELSHAQEFSRRSGELGIREQARLDIRPRKPKTLDELEDLMFGFKDLLTLGVAHPVKLLDVSAKVRNGTELLTVGDNTVEHERRISIFFQAAQSQARSRELHALLMTFTLPMVSGRIGNIVESWFTSREKLKPAIDLFIAVQRGGRLSSDTRFLFLAQAVETFHRRTHPQSGTPTEQHRLRLKSVLEAVPAEHTEWLEQQLQYSHEPRLRQRLKSLIRAHEQSTKLFISGTASFVDKVVKTRNYLTHYDESSARGAVLDGAGQYDLSQELKLLLELSLLGEIGFSEEELEGFTRKRLAHGEHKLIPFSE